MVIHEFWRDKKVFITGHTGFKGSWLSIWLSLMGAHVTGYALAPFGLNLFEAARIDEIVTSVVGDIRDADKLKRVMDAFKPDVVFHMAAQPLVRESYSRPVDTFEINIMGTVHLLEAVRAVGGIKSVVNVTTDKVYENREWVWGYRENEALGGYDPYSSSKACSELVTASYRSSYFNSSDYAIHGVALATARAGNVIGGGDWAKERLIPDCISALLMHDPIIIRSPNSIRPWQHVLEPLSGYLILAQNLYEYGVDFAESWNFGPNADCEVNVMEIVQLLCASWGEDASFQLDKDNNPHEATNLSLDCSKARSRLGWQPRWTLRESIEQIVKWVQSYQQGQDPREICIDQILEYLGSD